MSDTDFSEALKYPSSGKFAEKISSFKISEKDSIEAGPSKEYVSSGNVKENTFEKVCSQCDKSFKSFIMEEYIELKNTFRQAIINLKISKVHPKKN
jgi:protein-arginine kinase activator protein McsA